MKLGGKVLLFLVLLAVPLAGRWLWFHRGAYQPPEISPVTENKVVLPASSYKTYTDHPSPAEGRVVIDLLHGNVLATDDLSPLAGRLGARGVNVEIVSVPTDTL